eukprot:CAMPEP_0184864924 /NCGR_PEP_ID=MMETSP0580-20130426/16359_1 /TAXON_ID=1118495 /ORGANISM="Dactyliosolen fragilissimus" /LENGTH=214 /DNA_ID=CAMNT_0027363879 /DNA_START=116 /DNA_END=760 /DNA_ORIENTATION=+
MTDQNDAMNGNAAAMERSKNLAISQRMSSPSIQTTDGGLEKIVGNGLALVGVSIEQDAAYWEWHIETEGGGDGKEKKVDDDVDDADDDDESLALKFGVATKKNSLFYDALELNEDGDAISEQDDGTALMSPISGLRNGDVVGVAVQQSDLPMIQFLLNGEPLHELAINRFRGSVYPSIYMQSGFILKGVFNEKDFKQLSPHVRFGPLLLARGII